MSPNEELLSAAKQALRVLSDIGHINVLDLIHTIEELESAIHKVQKNEQNSISVL